MRASGKFILLGVDLVDNPNNESSIYTESDINENSARPIEPFENATSLNRPVKSNEKKIRVVLKMHSQDTMTSAGMKT